MLKLSSLMDEDTRIKCAIAGWVAVDENYGTLERDSNPPHLLKSRGHRKAGRPTKYWLRGIGEINSILIEARSDDAALEIANEIMTPAG